LNRTPPLSVVLFSLSLQEERREACADALTRQLDGG
jgi:hypothetical protein